MQLLCSLLVLFAVNLSYAESQFFDGQTLEEVSLSQVVERIKLGTIVIMGELHGNEAHHLNQREVLVKMAQKEELPAISVGMEFIDYTQQAHLDDFLNQLITEETFLDRIQWGRIPFENYRFQVKLPPYRGGWTYGINLPRSITGKVGQGGLESLTPEEAALLPPNFEVGNDFYFERFEAIMKGHVPDEFIMNYFVAQSLWDDTMAWRTLLAMEERPHQAFAIMVGDFHAAWGHGLADRLRKRGAQDVLVISQIQSQEDLKLDPKYGARGDFVFVSNEEKTGHSLLNEFVTRFTYWH